MDQINLEGAYTQLKEELPRPWHSTCSKCGKTLITEINASYVAERDKTIKLYVPSHCPKCAGKLDDVIIKIVAEINKKGEIHPKNKEGPAK